MQVRRPLLTLRLDRVTTDKVRVFRNLFEEHGSGCDVELHLPTQLSSVGEARKWIQQLRSPMTHTKIVRLDFTRSIERPLPGLWDGFLTDLAQVATDVRELSIDQFLVGLNGCVAIGSLLRVPSLAVLTLTNGLRTDHCPDDSQTVLPTKTI